MKLQPSRGIRKGSWSNANSYAAFEKIDGRHPWQTSVPDGFVNYPVRQLKNGKVAFFNFDLAKDMGLIAENHPNELTAELTQKIMDTFCIQIINEYDQLQSTRFPKETLKPHPHMATRYLQLQHSNKKGKTSGDGRSIWNGTVTHQGVTWDISSRGTGVTSLAPGAVQAQRPLKTGEGTFGYGCGQADLDELFGSALMAEIFYKQDLYTERVLTIIDLGGGCGIGVRSAPNLLRPAHLFLHLKQANLSSLKQSVDYFMDRQRQNGILKVSSYDALLKQFSLAFAHFAAQLERHYIFVWMDWDGDNILANGGIIDYGSVRQFGLRHDQYRFDDVDRFSTNINEQRGKARNTVQVFAQMIDFLKTKTKRPLQDFSQYPAVCEFDREFDKKLRELFLEQVGFDSGMAQSLLKKNRKEVEALYQAFSVLERIKTKAKVQKLPDGVNRPAIFKMRAALRELPSTILEMGLAKAKVTEPLNEKDFLRLVVSNFAKRYDTSLTPLLKERIRKFQKTYVELLSVASKSQPDGELLEQIALRAQQRNAAGRITGNSIEFLVAEILKARKKGLPTEQIQEALDLFIRQQAQSSRTQPYRRSKPISLNSAAGALYQKLVEVAMEFEDEI